LKENSIDSITETILIPLEFTWMLLAFIEKKSFKMISSDGVAGEVKVTITKGLKDTQTTFAICTLKETIFSLVE
jgi:plastocyanin domain-containing protein